MIRPATRSIFCFGLVLSVYLTGHQAIAQEPDSSTSFRPIHSLLIDRQFPILGIRWGAEVFVDVPLNNEPQGAQLTLRKAKINLRRRLNPNWAFKVEVNYLTDGGLELGDNYFDYSGWETARVKIGVVDPPFSLELVSSSAGLTFMEHALPVAALTQSRSGGFKFLKRTTNSILNAALFLFNPQQAGLTESGQSAVLHYVHSPISLGGRDNIHLGGSFSYTVNATQAQTRFRSRPEIATADIYYVDTGEISGASEIIRAGLEANRVHGRFSWQAELISTRVKRDQVKTVQFWGAYAFFSWFLTEDSRNYDFGQGQFNRLNVNSPVGKGGWGAFELAARASLVDLNDQDVIGGEERNISLGLNWYLNDDIRLMTNVVKVLNVNRPGNEYDGLDPLIFALRAQWLMD